MPSFDKNKFKEVLHYIIFKCGNLDYIGKTVLYKLLYFSDFDYYEKFEKYLTGESYYSLPHGPAPLHFDDMVKELKEEGLIKEIRATYHNHVQNKYLSLSEPKLSKVSAEEIKTVDKTIKKLCNMNATQVSAYSHSDMPWKATEPGEKLDYELVFYRNELMSVRDPEDD